MTTPSGASDGKDVLRVSDLHTFFPVKSRGIIPRTIGQVKAVDGVDLHIPPGETLGLVGESGSGKTTVARSVLLLVRPTSGKIEIDGTDITKLHSNQLMPVRRKAQMIFQDPYNALNPRHTVGTIVSAPFKVQGVTPPGGVRAAVQELMERVGLNPEHYNRYPVEFSGGQRQRIGIARAIALRPKLVICDEPVSALDVSIQAQILNLLRDLQKEFGIAYLFVAHDLAVIRQVSHRVAVMYLGHIVEAASREVIYSTPLHPYTHSLLSAMPVPDPERQRTRSRILLEGDLPSPINPPSGCVFRTRCFQAQERCAVEVPPLVEVAPGHQVACHFPVAAPPENIKRLSVRAKVAVDDEPRGPVTGVHFSEPAPPRG
ncbi:MAG TPA: oligopeptide/dipeptide ABC transporter ATP-binding protein [Candidatus Limnocylindrales bacterium]|nr:oligopeptide/dipeptide ABC transporter ATP-binding protein [Candidatus Limnocylindrales bacterium]